LKAEQEYLNAETTEKKIECLKKMISLAPGHKGAENLRKELRRRLARLKYVGEKESKKKSGKKGIRKEGFQFVLVGKTNSGKSCLLGRLTNAKPLISENMFSTKEPEIGTFEYEGVKAQVIDLPALGSEEFDKSVVHSADCLIAVVSNFEEYDEIKQEIENMRGKKIWVFNKSDLKSAEDLRKGVERIKSKKLMGAVVSCEENFGIDVLKQLMFREMEVLRVYTKEPGKKRTEDPIVLKPGATVKDVAEKIRKGFSKQIKETRLTGPSGKFPNQKVGLAHEVRDLDVVEFHT
tara:strand:- start:1590 stop:2465 length:876 start_codon:yes stop_codon:yes gene_type:complete